MGRFDKFRNRAIQFMYGRYGTDELYRFLTIVWLILMFVNIFVHSRVVSIILAVLFLYTNFRVLSRDLEARRKENYFYLKHSEGIRTEIGMIKNRLRDRKTHVYRKCPGCGKMLRLPKRKGKHSVCCPICKKNFSVKI